MNVAEAKDEYLKGKKLRRTTWDKDSYVTLTDSGKYQYIKDDKGNLELMSPQQSIDKYSLEINKDKVWEIL